MPEFLDMGKHAAYVWSSFALTFIVLAANVIVARRAQRRTLNDVRRGQEEHS